MTRMNILEVATKEFATYGYDGVSMNKLAAKLEVNKATIYYHFKDKKSLYQEVVISVIQEKREELEALVASDIDGKEKLKKYIELFILSVKEHPEVIPISLREMANLGVDLEGGIEEDFDQELEYVIKILASLNLKDKYKNLDPYILKSIIFGSINTYYSMHMSNIQVKRMVDFGKNGDAVLDYLSEYLSEILIDGLCKEK
jgi:AcrR family transcriptional regulator